jgi:hypothetical protein
VWNWNPSVAVRSNLCKSSLSCWGSSAAISITGTLRTHPDYSAIHPAWYDAARDR